MGEYINLDLERMEIIDLKPDNNEVYDIGLNRIDFKDMNRRVEVIQSNIDFLVDEIKKYIE